MPQLLCTSLHYAPLQASGISRWRAVVSKTFLEEFVTTTDWLTLALVVITAFYAWATFEILRANKGVVQAMEAQTEAQLRPYVIASVKVQLGSTLLVLHIENSGKSPAHSLRLHMDKDFFFNGREQAENIAKLPAFTQPIESLAPGVRIPFVLGVGQTVLSPTIGEAVCPMVFTVTAEYSFGHKTYSERNVIDLRPLLHSSAEHDPVGDEVKKLRESLEKLLRN